MPALQDAAVAAPVAGMTATAHTQDGAATLSLQEISDRLQIQDALLAYSTALDVPGRRWDQWYRCFTEDAVCEFPGIGAKSPAELQELFAQNDATRLSTQHLLLNIVIGLDGDEATARSECLYYAVNKGETPEKNELRTSGPLLRRRARPHRRGLARQAPRRHLPLGASVRGRRVTATSLAHRAAVDGGAAPMTPPTPRAAFRTRASPTTPYAPEALAELV